MHCQTYFDGHVKPLVSYLRHEGDESERSRINLVSITKSDKTQRKHNFRNSKPYQTINYISGMEAKANFNTLYC